MWKQSTGGTWHRMKSGGDGRELTVCLLGAVLIPPQARTSATRPNGAICQKCARKLGLDVEERLRASGTFSR